MTVLAEQLLDTFRHLPRDEQIAFVQAIEAELASSAQTGISDADLQEAERRLEEYRQDPSTAVSHEEALAYLKSI